MAATFQTPAQQPTNNTTSSPANPQLKRIVYSKYRELLGSYNDKANAIIESLPAYMVKEDRGFHFDPKIIGEVDKVVYGTPPAPPPLSTGSLPSQRLASQVPQYEAPACVQNAMMTKDKKPFTYTPGGIDLSQIKSQRMAKRLARNAQCEGASGQQQVNRPTQQSNGGTSPAAHLGATAMGMPFQVLPTGPPPPPPPQPNKAGPPPPPPVPQSKLSPQPNGNAANSRKSPTPQNFEPPPMGFRPEIKIPPNPMAALKKVPPPQEKNNFWMEEYRKERSKSPMVGNDENDSNRSPPKDQQPETNQYIQNSYNNQYQPQQNQYRSPSPQPMHQASPHFSPQQSPAAQRQYQPPQFQYTPSTPQPQSPSVQRLPQQFTPPQQYQGPTSPQYQPQQQMTLPMQQQQQQQQQLQQQQQQLLQQQQQQLLQQQQQQQLLQQQQQQQQKQQLLQQQQQQQQQQQLLQQQQLQQQQQQSVPWRSPRPSPHSIQNNVSRPREVASPAPAESPKPQPQPQMQPPQQPSQTSPAYLRSREMFTSPQKPQSPPVSQAFLQRDRRVEGAVQDSQQPARQPAANRWVSQQQPPQPAEVQPLNRIKSPPPPSSNGFSGSSGNSTGLRLQINTNPNSNTKERIIPIQLEQTPTPTRTPSAPGFGPQPFYTGNQPQYSSVPSPPLAQGATSNGQNSPSYVVRSPNQFVDQGYNNYPGSEDPNRVTSPTMQTQSPRIVQQTNTAGGVKTRVIPIALESLPDGPLNPNNVRGPISQQPLVIQNGNYRLFIHDCPLEAELQYRKHRLSDPRNQNTWGNGSTTPNQSKSFRVLQKITDTTDDGGAEAKPVEAIDVGDPEPQLQRPTFARPMGPGQMNSPTIEQMKRMQLSNDQQAYANRARNPDTEQIPAAKGAEEDPRYRGPSNPSVTFKKLQGAVERCSPSSTTDKDGTPPVMKQPQPTRYVNQRPVYSPEEQSQQYVHPSEQQVPEPKKYTGSAIPSRSFKILQAMTTPENAAEMEGSDVVESNQSITECLFQQPPYPYAYPYPYMPPCCPPHPPPPSSSGGDVYNWPNPSPHHHPYHPHHHHPYPPYPYYYYYPPNEYDSQNFAQFQARDAFFRAHSQSQDLPDIIITPSGDDKPQAGGASVMNREEREGSVIDTLTRKLSEIVKPLDSELNTVSPRDEKNYGGKELVNSSSSVKSECENNKLSAEDSSDELLTSSTDPTTTSSSEECAKQVANDGLHAIKSVTNIQVYNQKHLSPMDAYDDDLTAADGESMIFDEGEEEEEIVGEELEYDDEEVLIEEMDSDEEEEDMEDLYEDDEVIVMDDLSVIYEENETDILSPRPTSRISSSVSDATTIANEECEEEEEEEPVKENDDEENSNSVTVRLPLRFSFSRSSNDENIATVEVGNSQIEDKRRSFSIASVEADPEEEYESDCDVSVTISLSPSSGSFDRKTSLSPVPPKLEAVVAEEVDECDSEADDVSVSFSLPMRNKFMDQTWNGDLVNDIAPKKNKKKNDDAAVEVWMENSRAFEDLEKNECKLEIKDTNGWCADDETAPDDTEKDNGPLCLDKSEEEDPDEEVDFWATLQATRKEAQLFLEKTANYWGKKIEEREKNEVVPVASEPPAETQTDDDFWANIRVKNPIEKTKEPAPEENIEKVEEQKETKTKAEKPKKKKKIVKAPEKEPEPTGHVWSTIKVPNANNRAKIVESTIKMIQTKSTSKNPKESTKPDVKEIEVGDFVASIKTAYDKEDHSKVQEPSEEQAASAKPGAEKKNKKKKVEEVVPEVKEEVSTPTVTPEEKRREEMLSKLIREKAELKTQILNQKFAKAFILPEKPALMRGVLSEIEPEADVSSNMVVETSKIGQKWEFSAKISSPIRYEEQAPKKVMQEVAIVIEESEKVEKPKKKVIKSKKAAEESDGDTLKLPKPKTVKKSTKEPKKIKKKKSEDAEQAEAAEVKEAVQEVAPTENKETEDVDFWSEIQSSKASRDRQEVLKIETTKIDEKNKVATTETVETASSEQEDIDFWAVIGSSKGTDEDVDFRAKMETSRDSKAMILHTESGTVTENATFVVEQEEMVEVQTEEIDFWAEIQSSRKDTGHKDSVAVETKVETEVETKVTTSRAEMKKTQPDDVDFWSEIQSQREKVDTSPIVETPGTEEIDFWAEISTNKAKQSAECIPMIVEAEPLPEEKDLPVVPKVEKIEEQVTKPKTKKKVKSKTTESEESESSTKPKTKKKISKLTEESAEVDAGKVKTKKKTSITVEEISTEAASLKPKTKNKSTLSTTESKETASWTEVEVPKKSQIWSLPRADSAETDFWAEIETPKPKAAKKPNKVAHLHVYRDRDVELINVQPVPTYYAVYTEPKIAMDFWATISYNEEEPACKASEEREADFWASNSSGNETEVNSEVDTGKIDCWVTQRRFEASSAADRDATPKREEPSEEIDFWAEIKDPKDEDPLPEIAKDECEVRRSNYKKAMAFFTSTVNVERKDESPAPAKKLTKPSDPAPVPRESSVAPVPREASVVRGPREQSVAPVPRESSVVRVARESSVAPVPREASVVRAPREQSVAPVPREPSVVRVSREPSVAPVQREASVVRGPREQSVAPVPREPSVVRVARETSVAPVPREPSVVRGPREQSVAPVPRELSVVRVARESSVAPAPREPSIVPVAPKTYAAPAPPKSAPIPVAPEPNSWAWRESIEQDWEAPEEREVDDVLFIVEDHDGDDDAATLVENPPFELGEACYDYEIIDEDQPLYEEQALVEEEESSESISDSTPNHFQIEHQYPKPEPEPIKPKETSVEPTKTTEEIKISVKDRIFAFETGVTEPPAQTKPKSSLIVDSGTPKSNLSRNSSQRSESEIEEDDSGVMDMNKILSETDTESESFPELRKMSRYQRASTHSRLFKLLQDEGDAIEEEQTAEEKALEAEFNFRPRKKIVHNVSITRKQNPKALQEAESMTQRRERLSLPLHKNSSIDADNLSSPNSPASPIFGQPSQPVSDKLVNELVQSLLLKKSSSKLKNLPMEKLQAAAKRVLEEELDSLENTSLDSTPALTPQEFKSESYSDYYDTWSAKNESDTSANGSFDIIPSKAFKALQETTATAKRRPWGVRCPRVLSSKTVNRDLARVTESPEIFSRSSNSPEISLASERSCSIGRWRKV